MAKPKRTEKQALDDYPVISALRGMGKNQTEIAVFLSEVRPYKLTQQTISNDIKKLEKFWEQNAVVKIDQEKGKLKTYYEYMIMEAHKAWERSQEDAVKEREGYNKTQGAYNYTDTEPQVGDPRFMGEIRALMADYAELFGLKPAKETPTVEVNIKGYAKVSPDDWDNDVKK